MSNNISLINLIHSSDRPFLLVGTDSRANLYLEEMIRTLAPREDTDEVIVKLSSLRHPLIWANLYGRRLVIYSNSRPRSMRQIQTEKAALSEIINRIDGIQPFLLIYFLDHPHMINSTILFPKDLLDCFSDTPQVDIALPRKRAMIPPITDFSQQPVETVLRETDAKPQDERLFTVGIQHLYPPSQYQRIEQIQMFKENVFMVLAHLKGGARARLEVVKFDSPAKIKQEISNCKVLRSNRIAGRIYEVHHAVDFPGEFSGAIRSCADEPENAGFKKSMSLLQAFKEPHLDKGRIIDATIQSLKTLYNLGHVTKIQTKQGTMDLYREHILPPVMRITPDNLNSVRLAADNQELSILNADYTAFGWFENGPYFFEVADISRNTKNPRDCNLLLRAKDSQGKAFTLFYLVRQNYWQETFISMGLELGDIIQLDRFRAEGYLFDVFRALRMLALVPELPRHIHNKSDPRPGEVKNAGFQLFQQQEHKELMRFVQRSKVTVLTEQGYQQLTNPLHLINWYSSGTQCHMLADLQGPCHGDLNLNNVLIHGVETKNPSAMLIDLASFAWDHPPAFDCVKLETEIKTHILAQRMFQEYPPYPAEDSRGTRQDWKKFTSFVLAFERALDSDKNAGTNPLLEPAIDYLELLRRIREFGKGRYRADEQISSRLYLQQLLFYSVRTLTFTSARLSEAARTWAILSAMVAADRLQP